MKIKLKRKRNNEAYIACLLNVPCFHDMVINRCGGIFSHFRNVFLYREKKKKKEKLTLPEKVSRKYKIQN